jgi:hypothetical protein
MKTISLSSLHFALILIALSTVALAQESTGPFGLHRGMTREQVLQIVGKDARIVDVKADPDTLLLNRVPKSHPAFEYYGLFFSPTDGLLKIVASGKIISTNVFGEALLNSFIEIRDALSKNYGQMENLDYLKSGSIWTDPQDWMMGLSKGERKLAAIWGLAETGNLSDLRQMDLPNRILGIMLEATAMSQDKGNLVLSYEFEGWNEYVDANRKHAADAFGK